MAMAFLGRTLISKPSLSSSSLYSLFSSSSRSLSISRPSPLLRLRPLLSLAEHLRLPAQFSGGGLRCFATRQTTSSLNDPSPNWSNRPPKETILLDGCDFEHWLVVMEPPEQTATRDEIIDSYIKTLANVVESEEEARKSIYSVSTKHYYAFGCIVSEEISYKIKALPRVRWVLPDSYLDVKNKDYGGEPFIDGQAVPYDPKYHEEWVRNNARANDRSRRNDRPRNFDRSRNFERRRDNMQYQNRDAPPMPNQDFQNRDAQNVMPPRDMPPMPNRDGPNSMPPMPNRDAPNAMPPRDMPPMQNRDFQNRDFNAMPPRQNPNMGSMPSRDVPPSAEYSTRDQGNPSRDFQGRDGPNREFMGMQNRDYQNQVPNRDMGGMPAQGFQNQMPNHQNSYMPNRDGGSIPSGPGYQGGGPGYQGGGPGYQGGNPGYPGSGSPYQGGSPGYPGGGSTYQGGRPGYPGGGSTYQGGNPASPEGGSDYQGSGPGFQGRDLPGRDHQ